MSQERPFALKYSQKRSVYYAYKTPFGKITIASNGKAVTGVSLKEFEYEGTKEPDSITNECATQLLEYLSGKRSVFDIDYVAEGSKFQKQVWEEIAKIPYSHVITSKELAQSFGDASSYRQVGSAVRANPIAILIPAHRVIPQSGYVGKDPQDKLRAAFRELEKRYG